MTDAGVTLAQLFPVDKAALQTAIKDHLNDVAGARARLLAPVLDVVADRASRSLEAAMGVDLLEVAAKALSAARELHDYSGQDKPPAGAEAVLTFDHRTLSAPKVLKLHLEVDGFKLPPLELILDLSLVFETLAVTVRAGRVRGVGLGQAHAEAAVRYKDDDLMPRYSTPDLHLPSAPFDPGFAIP